MMLKGKGWMETGDGRMSRPENSKPGVLESLDLTEVQQHLETATNEFLEDFPVGQRATIQAVVGITARYTLVLEGGLIYWMTGTYLSAKTPETRSIIQENVQEDIDGWPPAFGPRCTGSWVVSSNGTGGVSAIRNAVFEARRSAGPLQS